MSWQGVSFRVTKVNADYYTERVKNDLIPAMDEMYPEKDGIFVQDGATSHTSNKCQAFLNILDTY